MLETLLPFLFAAMALTISPGPDILYVMSQSISQGRHYGIATAAGLVSGIVVHTTFVAFGVSAVIRQSAGLYQSITYAGAAYLLWLAYKVYRAPAAIHISGEVTQKSKLQLYKQGFVMNVLNPKVTLFFLAFFPSFINQNHGNIIGQVYGLGFVFMLQAFVIFVAVSIIAARLTVFLRTQARFSLWLKWLQIIVFVAIAVMIFV